MLGVFAKRLQLRDPVLLSLRQPGLQSPKTLRPQPVAASSPVLHAELDVNQPAGAQRPQVVAHRRPAHTDSLGDLARPQRPLAQQLHYPAAGRVSQRSERHINLIHVALNYTPLTPANQLAAQDATTPTAHATADR